MVPHSSRDLHTLPINLFTGQQYRCGLTLNPFDFFMLEYLLKRIYTIWLLMIFLLVAKSTFADECAYDCQIAEVNQYFNALDNVALSGSTIADIDTLLALTHAQVQYVHVEYQANFNRKSWREAFIRNLNRGFYQNKPSQQTRVMRTIAGKHHLAVEYAQGELQADGSWKHDTPLLAIFGFTDGKISLIRELW